MFSSEIFEIFKNTFFTEHLRVTTSIQLSFSKLNKLRKCYKLSFYVEYVYTRKIFPEVPPRTKIFISSRTFICCSGHNQKVLRKFGLAYMPTGYKYVQIVVMILVQSSFLVSTFIQFFHLTTVLVTGAMIISLIIA